MTTCPECGHDIRMHVKGASPRYRGCYVRPDLERGDRRPCPCRRGPQDMETIVGQLKDGSLVRLEPVR